MGLFDGLAGGVAASGNGEEDKGLFGQVTGWVAGLFDGDGRGGKDEGFTLSGEDGGRLDEAAAGQGRSEGLGGEVTRNDDGTLRYEGVLGTFDYDASQWAVGTYGEDAVPCLRYVGSETDGARIAVPDGVTNLDHAFANLDGLTSRPAVPASVASLEGTFDGCAGLDAAGAAGVDTYQGSGVTSEGKVSSNEELFARETGLGTKSTDYGGISYKIADGMVRLDGAAAGKGCSEALGGEVSDAGDGKLKYSGYLGEFEYDPDEWAVGTRTTVTEDGYSASVPVLRYVGGKNGANSVAVLDKPITIPSGVRVLDFAFEGNEKLLEVPPIPEGVESAHCAFANCTRLKMASEEAKDGSHQAEGEGLMAGGIAGALGAVGAGAAGGAIAGAAGGTVAPGVGNLIGGAVGLLGGGAYGLYTYLTKDGKGGDWYMPSSLKDASYMFDGCTGLTEAAQFREDSALMNSQGLYRDNEALGSDPVANRYGSRAVSDLTGTLVTTDGNSHMYEGTNTDYVMDPETAGKSSSKYWNDETGRFEQGAYGSHGAGDIAAAEDLSTGLEIEAVADGDVVTDLDVVSGGSASTGYYYDASGQKVATTDANAENQFQEDKSGMGRIIALVDRGVMSFAEYKLIGMFTGAGKGLGGKLLAGAATAGLQLTNILPKSIKPIVEGVANMVGPDTQIGGILNGLADFLPDVGDDSLVAQALGAGQKTSSLEQSHVDKIDVLTDEQKAQKDASDKTLGSIGGRMGHVLDNPFGADADDKLDILDGEKINAYMAVNARQMAKDNVFLTAANKSMGDAEFGEMGAMMELTGDALEEKAAQWKAEDGGTLSEEHRKMLAGAYMKSLEGLDAYEDAAADEIAALYANDPARLAQASNGLGKVMSATVAPTLESLLEMQREYGLFTDEELEKIDGMRFTGVNVPLTEYQAGTATMDAQEAAGWQETHQAQAAREAPAAEAVSAEARAEPASEGSVAARREGLYTDEQLKAMEEASRAEKEAVVLPGRRSLSAMLLQGD